MYRYKARMTDKATQQIFRDKANSLTNILAIIEARKNIFYHIVRIADNKLIRRGAISK